MVSDERRPLLYQRNSRFSRQPSPERVGNHRDAHSGQTSHVRTVINLINILLGVGLLSLPLAFRYTGWILGPLALTVAAGTTAYSARRLTQCMERHAELQSYLDIAGAAYGPGAQLLTTLLFSSTILAAGVASVILFGDTMSVLIPSVSGTLWKMICGAIVLPTQFFSLRLMAPVSILGLVSCLGLAVVIVTLGILKQSSPGSLREPSTTNLLPTHPLQMAASIGLFLAPWGAAASVPSFFRDMKTPRTYKRGIHEAYLVSYGICAVVAVAGYLMFGSETGDEIIYNILSIPSGGYPHPLLGWLIALTALMPITKITLSSRPFVDMLDEYAREWLCAHDDSSHDPWGDGVATPRSTGNKQRAYGSIRVLIRVLVTSSLVGIAIAVPRFDKIISIMGSALCCTIAVILPVAFHLRLCGDQLALWEVWCNRMVLVLGVGLAVSGTAGVVLS